MRTTIDLDEELLGIAKSIAALRGQTLSAAVNELAWKGLHRVSNPVTRRNGFPVFEARPGSRPVTSEHVAELLEQTIREDGRD